MVSKAAKHWYAIKAKPNTIRKASHRVGEEGNAQEFIIERNLRDAGFTVYMPAVHRVIRHHRTKEFIEKRFAMMVGYAFVDVPTGDFYALSKVDGVSHILGAAGTPMRMAGAIVQQLSDVEEGEYQRMQQQLAMTRNKEKAKVRLSKRDLEKLFPPGANLRLSDTHKLLGGKMARIISATGRRTVMAMIETLDNMGQVEIGIEHFNEVA